MNTKDFIIKTVLLIIAIIVIVGGWFSLTTIEQQEVEIEKLKETTQRQKNQISFLKNNNQMKTQFYKETDNQKIEETINLFVRSVFNVQEDNYKERRSNAERVLSQELFKQIFSDESEKLLYEHDVEDLRVYTRLDRENASAYLIFNHTAKNLANNKSNKIRLTVEVLLRKEEENWIVVNFLQLD
ncbi:hypothetical protein [Pseudalkalibacillus sp. SCS-8]|uniref:hypothetical protein n=1 Tax=Pseudalkalibacillus nanhaiensis TaxID=3115291 RepID=UPI0032DAC7D8